MVRRKADSQPPFLLTLLFLTLLQLSLLIIHLDNVTRLETVSSIVDYIFDHPR